MAGGVLASSDGRAGGKAVDSVRLGGKALGASATPAMAGGSVGWDAAGAGADEVLFSRVGLRSAKVRPTSAGAGAAAELLLASWMASGSGGGGRAGDDCVGTAGAGAIAIATAGADAIAGPGPGVGIRAGAWPAKAIAPGRRRPLLA
jgi:hypothetical protein